MPNEYTSGLYGDPIYSWRGRERRPLFYDDATKRRRRREVGEESADIGHNDIVNKETRLSTTPPTREIFAWTPPPAHGTFAPPTQPPATGTFASPPPSSSTSMNEHTQNLVEIEESSELSNTTEHVGLAPTENTEVNEF